MWSTAGWHPTRLSRGQRSSSWFLPCPCGSGEVWGARLSPARLYSVYLRGKGSASARSGVLPFQQGNRQAAETCTLQVVWLKLEALGTLQGIMGGMGARTLKQEMFRTVEPSCLGSLERAGSGRSWLQGRLAKPGSVFNVKNSCL